MSWGGGGHTLLFGQKGVAHGDRKVTTPLSETDSSAVRIRGASSSALALFPHPSRNQLTSLPACLCRLPLKVLIASNNKLVSLPEDIGALHNLRQLVSLGKEGLKVLGGESKTTGSASSPRFCAVLCLGPVVLP